MNVFDSEYYLRGIYNFDRGTLSKTRTYKKMKNFTLKQITDACGGLYVGDVNLINTPISSVERDSRQIKENSLFLAIKPREFPATIPSVFAFAACWRSASINLEINP